jgi:hypothetical protein
MTPPSTGERQKAPISGKSGNEVDRGSLPIGNQDKDAAYLNNLELAEFNRFSSPRLHSAGNAMRIDANR